MNPAFLNSAAVPPLFVGSPAVNALPTSVAPVFSRPPADTGSASLTAEPVFHAQLQATCAPHAAGFGPWASVANVRPPLRIATCG